MIDLWYLNTKKIDQEEVRSLSKFLPKEAVMEITRFKNHEDRRLKLFGKLIVRKYFRDHGMAFDWAEWHISPEGKPYYNESKKFSISHSGDYVTVAFSDEEVGNDIEKVTDFDIASVFDYLHPDEVQCIKSTSNSKDAFFKIWTRKEAYLKAVGKGIVEGLNKENCLLDELVHKRKWYLHSPAFTSDYKIALCTQIPNCSINLLELFPDEFSGLNG